MPPAASDCSTAGTTWKRSKVALFAPCVPPKLRLQPLDVVPWSAVTADRASRAAAVSSRSTGCACAERLRSSVYCDKKQNYGLRICGAKMEAAWK